MDLINYLPINSLLDIFSDFIKLDWIYWIATRGTNDQVFTQEMPMNTKIDSLDVTHEILSIDKADTNKKPRFSILDTGSGEYGCYSELHLEQRVYRSIVIS
jgi:hypothetical protein